MFSHNSIESVGQFASMSGNNQPARSASGNVSLGGLRLKITFVHQVQLNCDQEHVRRREDCEAVQQHSPGGAQRTPGQLPDNQKGGLLPLGRTSSRLRHGKSFHTSTSRGLLFYTGLLVYPGLLVYRIPIVPLIQRQGQVPRFGRRIADPEVVIDSRQRLVGRYANL